MKKEAVHNEQNMYHPSMNCPNTGYVQNRPMSIQYPPLHHYPSPQNPNQRHPYPIYHTPVYQTPHPMTPRYQNPEISSHYLVGASANHALPPSSNTYAPNRVIQLPTPAAPVQLQPQQTAPDPALLPPNKPYVQAVQPMPAQPMLTQAQQSRVLQCMQRSQNQQLQVPNYAGPEMIRPFYATQPEAVPVTFDPAIANERPGSVGTPASIAPAVNFHFNDEDRPLRTKVSRVSQEWSKLQEPYPYLEIVEQPASKAMRFRYQCEGRPAGNITGALSTPDRKTLPTIRVNNWMGKVRIVVSCVTENSPYRVHPHKVTSRMHARNGILCLTADGGELIKFHSLGIQCAKKKDVVKWIDERQRINIDPFNHGFFHKRNAHTIDLNAVRLAFQGFLIKEDKTLIPLAPVVSDVIYDKKSTADLIIKKLSHYSGTVLGGTEMILLCEKVLRDDIQIRFYEEVDSETIWEGFGTFSMDDVHKQGAIVFRTPTYRDTNIEVEVKVYVELRRPSDRQVSKCPAEFIYLPVEKVKPPPEFKDAGTQCDIGIEMERLAINCDDKQMMTDDLDMAKIVAEEDANDDSLYFHLFEDDEILSLQNEETAIDLQDILPSVTYDVALEVNTKFINYPSQNLSRR